MAKNNKNYSINGGFVVLPDDTIRSNQWKSLTASTRCVYIAMLTEFIRDKNTNPMNELTIDHDDIEEISGIAHSTVVRAMRELKDKNFLKIKQKGSFRRHKSTYTINGRYTHSGCEDVRW